MKILVLNCGSSSLKYQLIDMDDEQVLAKGLVERIGIDGRLKHEPAGKSDVKIEERIPDHAKAVQLVIGALTHDVHGVINSLDDVSAVGHRVVHGGEHFSDSVIIDESVKRAIDECSALAPLHNPPNLTGIQACESIMPSLPQVAVFDTAFHQTMPEQAYLYALPFELYDKYKIRKYGFHGTSHKFVSQQAAALLGKPAEVLKIITCHLGNGASICAVNGGKSVDTSMGFTPLEGLAMGTRSGDVDPAVLGFVAEKEGKTLAEVENMLNKQSGVLGLSGVSSDFRDLEAAAKDGSSRAKAALDVFHYRVLKYIGSYAAAMNGVDAIVFTAGLGENSVTTRARLCAQLGYLGVKIDEKKNNVRGKAVDFSAEGAKVRALLIPTNEELVIARDAKRLLNNR